MEMVEIVHSGNSRKGWTSLNNDRTDQEDNSFNVLHLPFFLRSNMTAQYWEINRNLQSTLNLMTIDYVLNIKLIFRWTLLSRFQIVVYCQFLLKRAWKMSNSDNNSQDLNLTTPDILNTTKNATSKNHEKIYSHIETVLLA